jgi:hypothetical protein
MRTRTPSYIPARSFAMALLDLKDRGWKLPEGKGIDAIVDVLKKDSLLDVTEFVNRPEVAKALQAANIPVDDLKARAQAEVQKLHDSVEVWFNNAMDRVSGAYKRYTQVLLILMGFVAAVVVNADTFQIWRTLAANDELRARVVLQVQEVMADSSFRRLVFPTPAPTDTAATDTAATDTVATDTTAGDTTRTDTPATDTPRSGATAGTSGSGTAKADSAALDRLKRTLAVLEGNDLDLGWTKADRDYFFSFPGFFVKLLGFLVTGLAVSLGAPFWFDTLNKIIAIRLAGRAPDEKPKNPEGGPKRAAEAAPR